MAALEATAVFETVRRHQEAVPLDEHRVAARTAGVLGLVARDVPHINVMNAGLQRRVEGRKFCVSNEGPVQLCINDAFRQFESREETMMASLDPSDGPGSCECDNCKKIGTISDRVFYLANRVAKAVGENYPGKCFTTWTCGT